MSFLRRLISPWVPSTNSLLLLIDAVLCGAIICTTSYTEIDWHTYMQQVEGFIKGHYVYTDLKGDTGPLVYPAGFLYIFSALYYSTERGLNIELAQVIFIFLYLFQLALLLRIYSRCRLPLRYSIVLLLSRRVHSLFLLRLFNDGVAMLLLYAAIALLMDRRWSLGCLCYSVAVSVKMNVLLVAPGLLTVLLAHCSFVGVVARLVLWCGSVQLLLGAPFLTADARAYVTHAFNLGRIFLQKWSVNFKFVPEPLFVSPEFGLALLWATALCWIIAASFRWGPRLRRADKELIAARTMPAQPLPSPPPPPPGVSSSAATTSIKSGPTTTTTKPNTTATTKVIIQRAQNATVASRRAIVLTLFESNVIGVCLSRSMHYQFYLWIFHMIPLVLALNLNASDDAAVASSSSSSSSSNGSSSKKDAQQGKTSSRSSIVSCANFLLQAVVLVLLEYGFNVYPATPTSSMLLCGGVFFPLLVISVFGRS